MVRMRNWADQDTASMVYEDGDDGSYDSYVGGTIGGGAVTVRGVGVGVEVGLLTETRVMGMAMEMEMKDPTTNTMMDMICRMGGMMGIVKDIGVIGIGEMMEVENIRVRRGSL